MPTFSTDIKKGIYIVLGSISLAFSILGLFLPILPTTPFLLLSAGCFYRGSPRIHNWLLTNKLFGETIQNYKSGRGLARSTKVKAIGLMWASILISSYIFITNLIVVFSLILIAMFVTVYITKLPTMKK